ncbi:FISUMP domain-containing protein [Flavobacterium sp.]|uniref:FISUMP domain-containing protein n=1 Tax=Flavobacterium sp. TaxID=239 RepID=UPI00286AB1B9|nr:FISUMP domain-containing protein [Flavobacterium sp.]
MKKYVVSFVCFLVVVNFIILSCTPSESSESNVVGLPSITTTPASAINMTTATSGGVLTSSGGTVILSRGVCYSTSPNPTTDDLKIVKPGSLGTFVCNFTGLTAGTQYYVRAYAKNSVGTAYGAEINFTTTTTAIALPIVTTNDEATDITETTANIGGNVTSAGGATITARGICYATTENPTIISTVANATGTTGTFTSSLTGLSASTVYYARAFATNSGGTGYGAQITFTTSGTTIGDLPILTTTDATSITDTGALSGGNVTSAGSSAITTRGICYATSELPTISDNILPVSGTTGSFGSTLSGLTADTMYFIRAYATNSSGTAYGNQIMFTTTGGTATDPIDAVCDGTQPTAVVPITSSTGKIWMDRNLGASRAATSSKDYKAYGCLYQWGRGNDDHASITWSRGEVGSFGELAGVADNGTTTVHSTTNTPGNALFVTDDQGIYDWRSPQNDGLWQGVSGINNPCPSGYRLPTQAEFEAETVSYSITGSTSAFNSIHKFPLAGDRAFDSGSVRGQGVDAAFWTSSIDLNDSFNVYISANEMYPDASSGRSAGHSVRCIKN